MKLIIDISKDRYDEIRAIHDGKALEQEPCGDAVSRQAVLEVIRKCHCEEWVKADIGAPIEALPSVTPQPKTGQWIKQEDGTYKCSNCKNYELWEGIYCASCGVKMVEPQEGSDKE